MAFCGPACNGKYLKRDFGNMRDFITAQDYPLVNVDARGNFVRSEIKNEFCLRLRAHSSIKMRDAQAQKKFNSASSPLASAALYRRGVAPLGCNSL